VAILSWPRALFVNLYLGSWHWRPRMTDYIDAQNSCSAAVIYVCRGLVGLSVNPAYKTQMSLSWCLLLCRQSTQCTTILHNVDIQHDDRRKTGLHRILGGVFFWAVGLEAIQAHNIIVLYHLTHWLQLVSSLFGHGLTLQPWISRLVSLGHKQSCVHVCTTGIAVKDGGHCKCKVPLQKPHTTCHPPPNIKRTSGESGVVVYTGVDEGWWVRLCCSSCRLQRRFDVISE
jgi:hypothetical protein